MTCPCLAWTGKTYWNGEEALCRRVVVRIGKADNPNWWCAGLQGMERLAVEIRCGGEVFYIDNDNGSGWHKVTIGRGSPNWGHRSLPCSEVLREQPVAAE